MELLGSFAALVSLIGVGSLLFCLGLHAAKAATHFVIKRIKARL